MGINHYNTVVGQANTANQNSAKAFTRFSGGGIALFAPKGALYTTVNKRNLSGTSVGPYGPTMTGNNPPLSGTHGFILTSSSFATLDYPGAGELH